MSDLDAAGASAPRRRRARRDPGDPPTGTARDRALRLLGTRWRSRAELERRLLKAGFEPEEISAALEDLAAAGLVDDRRFAEELVRSRARGRLLGDRAIQAALAASGVDPGLRQEALRGAGDEAERAMTLARKKAARMVGEVPEAATRRLYGFLVRRGYGPGIARDATRAALGEPHLNEVDQEGD